jgi:hypothetical protein
MAQRRERFAQSMVLDQDYRYSMILLCSENIFLRIDFRLKMKIF